jgi:hypothetical protein
VSTVPESGGRRTAAVEVATVRRIDISGGVVSGGHTPDMESPSIHKRAAAVERKFRANPALRYRHCRTGWDLGEVHADKVAIWYTLGRDIGPLIASYRARRAELDTGSGGHGA